MKRSRNKEKQKRIEQVLLSTSANIDGHVGMFAVAVCLWLYACVCVCVCGEGVCFVTATGQPGSAVTPEASVAHSHLSTPISAAFVPLSGLQKREGA